MSQKLWLLVGALQGTWACATGPSLEHVGRSRAPAPATVELDEEPRPAGKEATEPEAAPPPDNVVLDAALPFGGLRASDGTELGSEALMSELSRADAICVGERHGNAHDHFAQLATLRALIARRDVGGFELGLGLEMFQRPFQHALDAYAEGRIDRDGLVRGAEYKKRWGYPIQYYAPQLDTARAAGVKLVALNASQELTRAVAQDGLDGLPPDLARALPRLDLEDAAHRALFDRLMKGHPPSESMDQMYAAQVVWDEAMASRAAAWLSARAPARKILILAGRAHCARSAIPRRLERRGNFRVVSLLPELRSGHALEASSNGAGGVQNRNAPDAVAEAPEEAGLERDLVAAYDYRLMMYTP